LWTWHGPAPDPGRDRFAGLDDMAISIRWHRGTASNLPRIELALVLQYCQTLLRTWQLRFLEDRVHERA